MNLRLRRIGQDQLRSKRRLLDRPEFAAHLPREFDVVRVEAEHRRAFLDVRGIVEEVLQPEPCMNAELVRVAGAEVGGVELEHVASETVPVQSIRRPDPIDAGDQAAVLRGLPRRVRFECLAVADQAAVPLHTAWKHAEAASAFASRCSPTAPEGGSTGTVVAPAFPIAGRFDPPMA